MWHCPELFLRIIAFLATLQFEFVFFGALCRKCDMFRGLFVERKGAAPEQLPLRGATPGVSGQSRKLLIPPKRVRVLRARSAARRWYCFVHVKPSRQK